MDRAGLPGPGRQRLDAYLRYAALVAAQEVALDRDDIERFRALEAERTRLQEQMAFHAPEGDGWGDREADEGRRILEEAFQRHAAIERRLGVLKARTVDALRDISRREAGARRYTTDDGSRPPEGESRLDITL